MNRLFAWLRGRRNVALCLNSSFFGFFAHAGFLAELHRLGVRPRAVSGASAGAIVAGFYAGGYAPDEIERMVFDRRLRSAFYEWGLPYRTMSMLSNRSGHTGALQGDRALALLEQWLGGRRIEDCQPPLTISAANISRVRSELLQNGPLAASILASCAVPGMFATRTVQGDAYWDGGIADPVPFEHWLDDASIDTILIHLAINIEDIRERHAPHDFSFTSGLGRAYQIISDEVYRLKLELARRARKEVIVLRTITPRPGPFRLQVGEHCLRLGHATVRNHTRELRNLRE
ncbi:MAG: patatin-like phospholipase family protein [Leptospiraceae bacterium]|nr:patatin-like phospholipase family protein [Leptospiraceae bacterium]MCB1320934.1 patatin-like phospholipase family protein [Leptospiraceae bacterium]